jgi:hypothetical protein
MSTEEIDTLIKESVLYINLLKIEKLKKSNFYIKEKYDTKFNLKSVQDFLKIVHEEIIDFFQKNPENKILKKG